MHVLRDLEDKRGNAVIQRRLHANRYLAKLSMLSEKLKCKVRGDPGDPPSWFRSTNRDHTVWVGLAAKSGTEKEKRKREANEAQAEAAEKTKNAKGRAVGGPAGERCGRSPQALHADAVRSERGGARRQGLPGGTRRTGRDGRASDPPKAPEPGAAVPNPGAGAQANRGSDRQEPRDPAGNQGARGGNATDQLDGKPGEPYDPHWEGSNMGTGKVDEYSGVLGRQSDGCENAFWGRARGAEG